jgi:hypothetical protein
MELMVGIGVGKAHADSKRRLRRPKEIEVEEVYGSKGQTPNRGMNGMQSHRTMEVADSVTEFKESECEFSSIGRML